MNVYDNGDLIRVRGAFTTRELTDSEQATFDADGSLPVGVGQDPTTVVFKVKSPSGAVTTYTYPTDPQLVKQVAGSYYVTVDANVDGQWWTRWQATGTGQAAQESPFVVRSEFS